MALRAVHVLAMTLRSGARKVGGMASQPGVAQLDTDGEAQGGGLAVLNGGQGTHRCLRSFGRRLPVSQY